MKSILKPLLLIGFLIASVSYTYANFYDIDFLRYVSKPFLMPLLAFYYVASAKNIDIKYLLSLVFAFGGDLLFLSSAEFLFIAGMCSFLLYILINMIIIANRIGQIKLAKFYIIILPFIFISIGIITTFFRDVGLIKLIFIIYASILGLYSAFALYWYIKEKNKWVLLHLIGVLLFFVAAVGKGLEITKGSANFYKIVNMILYIVAMLSICIAYANHTTNRKVEVKEPDELRF